MQATHDFDVIVIGGGPAGATAAMVLARAGKKTLVLEKAEHPRFHIGESFLPANLGLIEELGLLPRLRKIPHVPKFGAEFGFGDNEDDETNLITFEHTLQDGCRETFNIERAPYDEMLLNAAADDGATVKQNTRVDEILRIAHNDVAVRCGDQTYHARWIVDASGQSTVVGRHLKTRSVVTSLQNVAYFGHFEGVQRLEGEMEGHPTIVMCKEGWFWIIPINRKITSCGFVMHKDAAKKVDVPADQMMRWAIDRCPLMKRRTANAKFPEKNGTIADFTYRCEPYAGPGYYLVGDAATFIDPVFATGACLGMKYAQKAAQNIVAVDNGQMASEHGRKDYIAYVKGSSKLLFRLVHGYYQHSFRELLMNGTGPMQVERAIISLLAGHVFPKPSWPLTWRFWLFEFCMKMQGRGVDMVPRHKEFSLLEQEGGMEREQSREKMTSKTSESGAAAATTA